MFHRIAGLALLTVCIGVAAEDAPAWLKSAAEATPPAYGPKVSTVELLNEEHTVVADSGKLTTTTRTAIRILASQRVDVAYYEQYDTRSGKVRDFAAWMIAPSGHVKKYGKDEILDLACAENDIYNECRRRFVSGKRDAEAGAVFGYEATVEHQSFSQQLRFHFQDSAPVLMARFQLTIPAGWELKTAAFNGAPAQPVVSGNSYTWQMEKLAWREPEPSSPSVLTIVPWVGVNLIGGAGKHAVLTWPEAAKLLAELNSDEANSGATVSEKAIALTQGAVTELDKIRAIGRFTQQVNYVSIQTNLAKGGGIRPHPAPQVLQKLYGDCKDKANLTRAMLKAVGIESYPVAIYSGDRTRISRDWPSLGPFNHAITAIRVKGDTKAPAILEHPALGKLLFFDPTDPYVPVGLLPDHEQGSLALVGAPDGDLVKVPVAPPEASTHEREVEAILGADGSLTASFVEKWNEGSFAEAISQYRGRSKDDYLKMIERRVGRSVPGAITTDIQPADDSGRFVLKAKLTSTRFAQIPNTRMIVFRAAVLRHSDSMRLTAVARTQPVVMDADAIHEKVRIAVPAEYKIDELPDPIHVVSPFGKCDLKWTQEPGFVIFERSVELPAQSVPADQYTSLRKFLDTVYGGAEQPAVLIRVK
ncbi:MAG: DUF3857 domain-containing protein [Bryobacteraceae bacterium]